MKTTLTCDMTDALEDALDYVVELENTWQYIYSEKFKPGRLEAIRKTIARLRKIIEEAKQ